MMGFLLNVLIIHIIVDSQKEINKSLFTYHIRHTVDDQYSERKEDTYVDPHHHFKDTSLLSMTFCEGVFQCVNHFVVRDRKWWKKH